MASNPDNSNSLALLSYKVSRLEACMADVEKRVDKLEQYKDRIGGMGLVLTFAASFAGMVVGAWIKHFF